MALQRPCFNLTHTVSCTCHEERRCQVISEFDDGRDVLEAGSVTLAPAGPLRFLITSFPASCLVLTFRVCGIASVVPARPGLEARSNPTIGILFVVALYALAPRHAIVIRSNPLLIPPSISLVSGFRTCLCSCISFQINHSSSDSKSQTRSRKLDRKSWEVCKFGHL